VNEIVELAEKAVEPERKSFLSVKESIDTSISFIEEGSLHIYVINNDEEQTIRLGYKGNLIVSLD
jgi:hypothetical protein